jgi:acetyl-CoA carboxylase carboxyltransferase component
MTIKKVLRAQAIAAENRLPLVYLVDSSGVFLPMQDEVFPDDDDFGRIFRNNAVLSARGIPQFAAIMGNCVAGGAYLPVLCDTVLMTEGSGLYLAGPALVKAAIGQDITHEQLGGAAMHAAISGTVDYHEANDETCLDRLRRLIGLLPPDPKMPWDDAVVHPPVVPAEEIFTTFHSDPSAQYDVRHLIAAIVDHDRFDEYREEYGRSLVCGFARLGGMPVGIVANQRLRFRPEGGGPLQFGGVIYADSADKAARFVLDCNQSHVPLLFIQDVNGFDVGRDAERSGIIRRGAKLVNAVSNSVVPKITLLIGHSFGAGHYALCGKAFDPRFLFAWPTARYAVMGAQQAARTMLDVNVAALKRQGRQIDDAELKAMADELRARYDRETDIRYAAARGWIDAIIDPMRTREVLIAAFDVASRRRESTPLQVGVFQV